MADLSGFPITKRWPARHPDRIQLYSVPTPNGVKVSIMLEETGLPYEPHYIDIGANAELGAGVPLAQPQRQDPGGHRSQRARRRTARALRVGCHSALSGGQDRQADPQDPARRYETIQWVFFQMANIGPMFGQVGYFHKFAGREIADKRPLTRYVDQSKRLLGVIETCLAGGPWIMGEDFTIADVSMLGWVRNLVGFYGAGELVQYEKLNTRAGLAGTRSRPAGRATCSDDTEPPVRLG